MASRTWLAVLLACLVWFIYLKWFVQTPVEKNKTTKPIEKINVEEKKDISLWHVDLNSEKEINYKTDLLDLSFIPKSGKLTNATCLKYKETISKDSPFISIINKEKTPFSLATIFSNPILKKYSETEYDITEEKNGIIFKKTFEGGYIEKKYFFDAKQYIIRHSISIKVPPIMTSDLGNMVIPLGGKKFDFNYNTPLKAWEVVVFQNDSVKRKQYDKIPQQEILQGETKWVAFGNKYFVSAIVNQSKINPDVMFVSNEEFKGVGLKYPLKLMEGENSFNFEFTIYLGPKDLKYLEKIEGFKKLVDYGMWAFLAYPLLAIMKFFFSIVKNWGVAIILLTIFVRVLLYPLSLKQYHSMKAMQKLQPQLKSLKEKYKDDLKKFNQEQMNLFKTHKINPMGGCLPLLVQLPVFIALYSVLSNSIELFHSPFIGWIKDLSVKDQFYVLPVLMGIVMFIQQKMTPTAGMDPTQEKIMLFMPIIFTIIMINLPSGLTLYIFVSTLLGIVQQWVINRSLPKTAGTK